MRLERALAKLHGNLVRRGITTTAAALSTLLSAHAVQVAPPGLAAAVSSASLAGAAAGTGVILTLLKLMAATHLKFGLAALVTAGVAITLVIQHQSQIKLR